MNRIELGPVPARPHRCPRCKRVRFKTGQDWRPDPSLYPGEVATHCALCTVIMQVKADKARRDEEKKLLQDRAKGYGPAPEGTDPFAGFHEP